MRVRALVILAISVAGVLGLLLAAPLPAGPAPPPSLVVGHAAVGDRVQVRVAAFDAGIPAYAGTLTYDAGLPSDGPLSGLSDALVNATPGQTVDATLPAWRAFGNWSWENVVNVTRVRDVPREQTSSQRALERYVGHPVAVGDRLELPRWPVIVTALDNGAATLRADVAVGDHVARLQYWPSTVLSVNDSAMRLRDDATVGTPVDVPEDDGRPAQHGNVTLVDESTVRVDFNAPHAGDEIEVRATVLSVKPGASTMELVARAEALDCQAHHAGFVAFQAASDIAPNPNGTAWVNVTVGDPWRHALVGATVRVGNETQPVPSLRPGETATMSFLTDAGATLPVAVDGTAHFSHGGGIPDDASYHARSVAVTSVRRAASVDVQGARAPGGAAVAWGRALGWLAIPLMLYPAWEGYRSRQARLAGTARAYSWPRWLDLHTMPAVAATAVGFGHGAILMLDAYRGNSSAGVWTGAIALALLGLLGLSGLVMARWVPTAWKNARKFHAATTVIVLVAGLVHALLIGTTFRFLR